MQKFLHFLEEQTPKKNYKKRLQKFNSKWPLYSKWRPKLNLRMKQRRLSAFSIMHFYRFWAVKNKKKYLEKILNGRSI
jgi:uncharacterized protein YfbU (UPF0304 family)